MIDPRYAVYGVSGVAAIPLVEEHARTTLRTIASRYSTLPRSSLVSGSTLDEAAAVRDFDTISVPDAGGSERLGVVSPSNDDQKHSSSLRQVQFSSPLYSPFDDPDESTQLRVPAPSSPRSSLSDESTHSSEHSVSSSPVAKTLASRLSFWSRLSKRTPDPSTSQTEDDSALNPESHSLLEEQVVNKIMDQENDEPATMVNNILAATAPPPASVEEKETELERKIVRECIKEFSKGGMYFAYNFGKSVIV